jgi:hypothetical protein
MAYLINAHKNLKQLERLVAKLNHDEVDFFIHIDKKVDDTNFALLMESLKIYNPTMVSNRVDVMWSGFTQVEATLQGLHTILQSDKRYEYINFISGQDYPIKKNTYILDFLLKNNGYEFIDFYEISPASHAEFMTRFQRYCLVEKISNDLVRLNMERALRVLLPKRKIPNGFSAYGGSQWWTISSGCAKYILDFVNKENKFVNFFKLTNCPDETFFQTIILNSAYRDKVYKHHLHYIDWPVGAVNPKVLTKNDFNLLESSNKLFARKFDAHVDEEVLDMIDANTSNK